MDGNEGRERGRRPVGSGVTGHGGAVCSGESRVGRKVQARRGFAYRRMEGWSGALQPQTGGRGITQHSRRSDVCRQDSQAPVATRAAHSVDGYPDQGAGPNTPGPAGMA